MNAPQFLDEIGALLAKAKSELEDPLFMIILGVANEFFKTAYDWKTEGLDSAFLETLEQRNKVVVDHWFRTSGIEL